MPFEILLTETLGRGGTEIVYVKPPESNRISRLDSSIRRGFTNFDKIWDLFKEIFLPRGYPESVSSDYTQYQIWDTVQAFCSTISHTLTTHAVLVGVGVGNKEASALGAAITWIFKDGVGMLSKILFAWTSGSGFDADCKKWRLFADFVNDIAMFIELTLSPLIPSYSMQVLCLSSCLKSIVGVAGGATRAAVTQHQAISENTGDVSAKDGSQETCVNLLASIVGILILTNISDTLLVYPLFILVTIIHLYSNYMAVKCLQFKVFNAERFHIVLKGYLTDNVIPTPEAVSKLESVNILKSFTDVKLTGRKVKLGSSLQGLNLTSNQLRMISSLYKEKNFMLVQSTLYIRVILSQTSSVRDLFQSYFHALLLAIASSHTLSLPLDLQDSVKSSNSPYNRFQLILTKLTENKNNELLNIEQLMDIESYCSDEFNKFWKGLVVAGWCLDTHQFHGIDAGWRAMWGHKLQQTLVNQHLL